MGVRRNFSPGGQVFTWAKFNLCLQTKLLCAEKSNGFTCFTLFTIQVILTSRSTVSIGVRGNIVVTFAAARMPKSWDTTAARAAYIWIDISAPRGAMILLLDHNIGYQTSLETHLKSE